MDYSKNIQYHTATASISLRSINNAYVFANVIKSLNFTYNSVSELCPGNCNVVDIALCLDNFKGNLYKIDYSEWEDVGQTKVKRPFKTQPLIINVIKQIAKIPNSDLIIMNHGVDDLFIGLWAEDRRIDYFGVEMKKIESSKKCWEEAIKSSDKYVPILENFVYELSQKLNDGGFLIITNYPSSFETHYRLTDRIDFIKSVTDKLSDKLVEAGLVKIDCDLDLINGPKGSKFPESFYIYKYNSL